MCIWYLSHISKRNGLTEHVQLSSGTRYLTFGLSFYLLIYVVGVISDAQTSLKHRLV